MPGAAPKDLGMSWKTHRGKEHMQGLHKGCTWRRAVDVNPKLKYMPGSSKITESSPTYPSCFLLHLPVCSPLALTLTIDQALSRPARGVLPFLHPLPYIKTARIILSSGLALTPQSCLV